MRGQVIRRLGHLLLFLLVFPVLGAIVLASSVLVWELHT